jgi:glycosyltransferase involved in cell wall biosynthesis
MLLDFANRAFEHDIALRVITPLNGPLVRILKNIGVPTEVVPAPEGMLKGSQQIGFVRSIPSALLGVWRWSRQLAKHEFIRDADVYYSIAFKPHLALAAARKHPVVWHLHEFPPETTGGLWRRLARRVPDALIANSEVVGRDWGNGERGTGKEAAASRQLTTVIPNGINLDRFKPAERSYWIHDRLYIPREHRLIGMPAVFARWKGQLEVIRAFEQITDEFEDVHLVIVGGSIYDTLAEQKYGKELMLEIDRAATGEWQVVSTGGLRLSGEKGRREEGGELKGSREEGVVPEGSRVQEAVPSEAHPASEPESSASAFDEHKENTPPSSHLPRIHHLPFQKKIETAYPEFDFAVHYSTRPEPFGRVVVESMACGVPVIAAYEGGPIEILGGGIGSRREAGWLAEPRNPDALADILRGALKLPKNLAQSIGEAGRRRAEDLYSWRRFAGEVAGVLRAVAGMSID